MWIWYFIALKRRKLRFIAVKSQNRDISRKLAYFAIFGGKGKFRGMTQISECRDDCDQIEPLALANTSLKTLKTTTPALLALWAGSAAEKSLPNKSLSLSDWCHFSFLLGIKGAGEGSEVDFNFWVVFNIGESSYQKLFSEWKNIVPSQSYRILKSQKYIQLHCTRELQSWFHKNQL